jgi:hypothetical protein
VVKSVPDSKPLPGLDGFQGNLDDLFKGIMPKEPGAPEKK